MRRILKPNIMVPGGYQYTQPETGRKFGGNSLFKAQCREILAHRKGNHLARATLDEVAEDLIAATCDRVPGVCGEITVPAPAPVRQQRSAARTQAPAPDPAPAKISAPAAPTVARKKCGSCGGRKAK